MVKINKLGSLVLLFCIPIFCSIFLATPSYAASTVKDTVYEKALFYGISQCYQNGQVTSDITAEQYRSGWKIVSAAGTVSLPYGFSNTNSMNCANAFNRGYELAKENGQNNPAVIPPIGKAANADDISAFLKGMGYTEKTTSSTGKCATYTYKHSGGGIHTIRICAPKLTNGKIDSDKLELTYSTTDPYDATKPHEHGSTKIVAVQFENGAGHINLDCAINNPFSEGGCSDHKFTKGETDWAEYIGSIFGDLQEHAGEEHYWTLQSGINQENYGSVNASYSLQDPQRAALDGVSYMTNERWKYTTNLRLTAAEKAVLLQSLLEDFYKTEKYGCDLSDEQVSLAEAAGYKAARVANDGVYTTCYVKATTNQGSSIAGYNSRGYFDGTPMSFDDILAKLNALKVGQAPADGSVSNIVDWGEEHPDGNPNGDNTEATCMDATALGWVLCPTLQIVGDTVQAVYGYIEANFLEVESSLLSVGEGTNVGWDQMRDAANIFFVIVLAIIILSQVTGIGVSNYGIKKTLPTLIIVAILVNLSFIVCQLAVDISNIVGSSIEEFFMGLPTGTSSTDTGAGVKSITNTLLGMAGVVAGGVTVWMERSAILPQLLLVLIVAVIGVIFFFILLAVRKAGILILITLAPLAIICYALPNTKKLFDRWFKLFTGLLLVYPICGAMMGGGYFVSNLLLKGNNADFFMNLVAMLLQIVPFFFIPTLLRSSMAALGNIGTRLSNMGSRLSRSASGTIGKTASFQDWQRHGRIANATRKYNRLKEGKGIRNRLARMVGEDSKLGQSLTNSSKLAKDRAVRTINREGKEDRDADLNREPMLPGTLPYRTEQLNQQAKLAEDAARGYEAEFASNGSADSLDKMEDIYKGALNDLIADENNDDAKARLTAAERVLLKTDAGRLKMQYAQARAGEKLAQANDDFNAGYRWSMGSLLRESRGSIKNSNRSHHEFLSHIAGGGAVSDANISFEAGAGQRKEDLLHTDFDRYNFASYTPQQLADADDEVHTSIRAAITKGALQPNQLRQITASARDALLNDQVAKKPKIMAGLHAIANGAYASNKDLINAESSELNRIAQGIRDGYINSGDNVVKLARNVVNQNAAGNGPAIDPAKLAQLKEIVALA